MSTSFRLGAAFALTLATTTPAGSSRARKPASRVAASVAGRRADNRTTLKSTLADLATVAHTLAAQQGPLAAGLKDAARTAQLAAKAGEQLGPTLGRISAAAQEVRDMAQVANAASARAGKAAEAAASSVQQAGAETLPELSRLMQELGALSVSLRQLSE